MSAQDTSNAANPWTGATPLGPDEVIETQLLKSRPTRARKAEAENAALLTLAQALNDDPASLAQRLVEAASDLTGAPSAGLSLTDIEDGRPIFRWIATTGEYARYLNGTMPRDFSPCGEVLKRGEPLLMRQMRRVYTYVDALHAPPAEVLLVPFADNGQLVGTIWVAAHDHQHPFDAEDLRVVQSLAFFASAVSGTIGLVRSLQAKEALQAKELAISERQRLQMGRLFQQTPGFFALLDGPEHTLAIVNDAFQRLTGQRAVVGAGLLEALPELRGQGIAEMLHRAFTTGEAQHGHDVSLTLVDARGTQQIAVDFVYQPMVDATGAVTGVLLQGHDMTERRRAVDALEEADRHKDEFLALLAHEIRTPLSSIRLANQVLRQLPADREPRHVRATGVIERQTSTLSAMVDDLMDLASVRAGKFVLRRARVSVQDAIASALEACQPAVSAREQRLELDIPEQPLWVDADGRRLAQVFANLVGNASKYSAPGTLIRLDASATPSGVRVSVADEGMGIAPDVLPRIFDLFMQASTADRPSTSGLGLGLYLVSRLVELHQGRISVQSTPGEGSRFTVELPAAAAEAPAPRDAAVSESRRLAALRELMVLDTPEETAFDELTRAAADICETPIALISLVDDSRQWFKSRVGLQAVQTPREHAFCAHAIARPSEAMQVTDASLDARFATNPLVTGDPNIRFYAGAPLVTASGEAIGTLCVIDNVPRQLDPSKLETLQFLAQQVMRRLEERHHLPKQRTGPV